MLLEISGQFPDSDLSSKNQDHSVRAFVEYACRLPRVTGLGNADRQPISIWLITIAQMLSGAISLAPEARGHDASESPGLSGLTELPQEAAVRGALDEPEPEPQSA
jgi:hypothetical protein